MDNLFGKYRVLALKVSIFYVEGLATGRFACLDRLFMLLQRPGVQIQEVMRSLFP